jgi:hypothetical protein
MVHTILYVFAVVFYERNHIAIVTAYSLASDCVFVVFYQEMVDTGRPYLK